MISYGFLDEWFFMGLISWMLHSGNQMQHSGNQLQQWVCTVLVGWKTREFAKFISICCQSQQAHREQIYQTTQHLMEPCSIEMVHVCVLCFVRFANPCFMLLRPSPTSISITVHGVSTATWYNMTADLQIKSCRVVVKKTDYSTRRVCERTPLIQLTTCTAPCIECHQLLLHPTGPGLYGSWSVPGGNTALLWSVSHNPESMGSCLLRIVRHVSAEGWWC